jgi:hypothetical protein
MCIAFLMQPLPSRPERLRNPSTRTATLNLTASSFISTYNVSQSLLLLKCSPSHTSLPPPFACTGSTFVGLARTIYIHRIWPYIWWFPCQNYRMYTVYIWLWPTLHICKQHTALSPSSPFTSTGVTPLPCTGVVEVYIGGLTHHWQAHALTHFLGQANRRYPTSPSHTSLTHPFLFFPVPPAYLQAAHCVIFLWMSLSTWTP